MPRPGCVWSHVLLLDTSQIDAISDLSALRRLCLRPDSPEALHQYQEALLLNATDTPLELMNGRELNLASGLLDALYTTPEESVVVLDERNLLWERIVFAIWSQQWPRLRRHFAFSTGSLGDRRLTGVNFDLQISPLSSRRLWNRVESPTRLLDVLSTDDLNGDSESTRAAAEDLTAGSSRDLRTFLFKYGDDVQPRRHAFVKLLTVFEATKRLHGHTYIDLFLLLASTFPDAREAIALKHDQLIESANRSDSSASWTAIYFLVHAGHSKPFSNVKFDFRHHVPHLWQHKRADMLALLGSVSVTEKVSSSQHADAFIRALADVLEPDDVPEVWRDQPLGLSRIVSARPGLGAFPAAWRLPREGQISLWDALSGATEEPQIWARICGAMLTSRSSVKEKETVKLAGSGLLDELHEWLSIGYTRLSEPWRSALAKPLNTAFAQGSLSFRLLALTVAILPPDKARAIPGTRDDVQALAGSFAYELPPALILPTAFWLTAVGLRTPGADGAAILIDSFFRVYDAVARSQYPAESWALLAPILPEALFGLDWDRCGRLRHALRDWVRDNPTFAARIREAIDGKGSILGSL
jgi:hypothetical protein